MSLFRRLQTTFRADAHGIVDALEDQALLLRQHVRDAETEVQRKRARVNQLDAEERRLDADRERASAEAVRSERDAELALGQGRDDLARYALKQMLQRRRSVARADALLTQIRDERKELERALETQTALLAELRERVEAHLAAREAGHPEIDSTPVTDEQVELELLRRKGVATAAPITPPTEETKS
jgi:phage shock protein A